MTNEEAIEIPYRPKAMKCTPSEIIESYQMAAVLDKISTEISEYGSLCVEYKIEGHSDKDIEKIVENVLKQAKQQVLDIIDKYRQEG